MNKSPLFIKPYNENKSEIVYKESIETNPKNIHYSIDLATATQIVPVYKYAHTIYNNFNLLSIRISRVNIDKNSPNVYGLQMHAGYLFTVSDTSVSHSVIFNREPSSKTFSKRGLDLELIGDELYKVGSNKHYMRFHTIGNNLAINFEESITISEPKLPTEIHITLNQNKHYNNSLTELIDKTLPQATEIFNKFNPQRKITNEMIGKVVKIAKDKNRSLEYNLRRSK